jgi:hypothetical protein
LTVPAHRPGSAATSAVVVHLDAWDATAPVAGGLDPAVPVVVVGADAAALGAVAAAALRAGDGPLRPGRVAVFVGDPIVDAAAVAECAAELFPAS